jgi:hypothetical protein
VETCCGYDPHINRVAICRAPRAARHLADLLKAAELQAVGRPCRHVDTWNAIAVRVVQSPGDDPGPQHWQCRELP